MNISSIPLLYRVKDILIINNKKWIVKDITNRFGWYEMYGLSHKRKDGIVEQCSIGVDALETLMGRAPQKYLKGTHSSNL